MGHHVYHAPRISCMQAACSGAKVQASHMLWCIKHWKSYGLVLFLVRAMCAKNGEVGFDDAN